MEFDLDRVDSDLEIDHEEEYNVYSNLRHFEYHRIRKCDISIVDSVLNTTLNTSIETNDEFETMRRIEEFISKYENMPSLILKPGICISCISKIHSSAPCCPHRIAYIVNNDGCTHIEVYSKRIYKIKIFV